MDALQVSNGTQSFVPQSDPTIFLLTLALVIGTFALVGINWYFSSRTSKQTQKSLELATFEIKNRLRPLLEFEKTKASLETRGDERDVRFFATLKNSGPIPARNIYGFYKETVNTDVRSLVQETEPLTTSIYVGTLRPNGRQEVFIIMPWPQGKETSKLVIRFKYHYFDQKEELIALVSIVPGSDQLSHVWYDYEDIKKAKEPLGRVGADKS